MLDQERDIGMPLSQRRQLNGNDVEPVVKILSEVPSIDLARQVLVGGRDHSGIDFDAASAADTLELALLKHAQELFLRGERQLPYFVQKDRSLVGELEATFALSDRAGKGALLVPEELAFQECLRQGRTVDLDQRSGGVGRVTVDDGGDELLAGPGLPRDQHGRVRPGNPAHDLVNVLHGGTIADKNLVPVAFDQQANDPVAEVLAFEEALDGDGDFLELERLGDIVERPKLHRLDRRRRGAKGGHDDDWQFRVA